MSNAFLGQISMFGGNFAPRGWAFCNGQLLPIAQNDALFTLIGTTYGGDGITTFALPNLQSRLPVHFGTGPGLSNYQLGQAAGTPNVTLSIAQMPIHNHMIEATTAAATSLRIGQNLLTGTITGDSNALFYWAPQSGQQPTPTPMASGACNVAGGSMPHDNLMPSLCITFIIALQGIFPSRN
jgi:microcystin-dependent protein